MIETPYRFEPAFLEGDLPQGLVGLTTQLASASARLPGKLPTPVAVELADLVRIANCYHSNLIEGHDSPPVDIEKAMASQATAGWPLIQEAHAHIEVQRHLDRQAAGGHSVAPTSVAFLKDVHRRFYEAMPPDFKTLRSDSAAIEIVPGAFRTEPRHDVQVGFHTPPASASVTDFMQAFEERFDVADRQPAQKVLAIPSAHHRLGYIHPFIDGNGRVGRLMSHTMARRADIGAAGLWPISRGLALGLTDRGEYKRMMNAADAPRRNDCDGRGNLSRAALLEFSEWFLEVAFAQVTFCAGIFELETLAARYKRLAEIVFEGKKDPGKLIAKTLELGELTHGDAHLVLGRSGQTAHCVIAACVARGFLRSDTPKGPLRVAFPVGYRTQLFPGLFADEPTPDE